MKAGIINKNGQNFISGLKLGYNYNDRNALFTDLCN